MFASRVVHEHHGEAQFTLFVHRLKAEDSGGGLFATADHVSDELRIVFMDHVDKVSTVIDDDVRPDFDNSPDTGFVFFRGRIVNSEDIQSLVDKGGGDVILGTERVASGHIHIGPGMSENLTEVCGLRFQVDGKSHFLSGERFGFTEFFFQPTEKGHVVLYPFYLDLTVPPKLGVAYFAHIVLI